MIQISALLKAYLLMAILILAACGGGSEGDNTDTGSDNGGSIDTEDTIPNSFAFSAIKNAEPNEIVISNTISVSGINTSVPISITGGEYALDDNAFTAQANTVNTGQRVRLRVRAPGGLSATSSATLNIGGALANFDVSTRNANTDGDNGGDNSPNAFFFVDRNDVQPNTPISSNTITVRGIDKPTSIAIVGGRYAIDGQTLTDEVGLVRSGQTVVVEIISSAAANTTKRATLTIGDISDSFDVTTRRENSDGSNNNDTRPNQFFFVDKKDVDPDTVITSNTFTIRGINAPSPVTISGGQYAIDNTPFTNQNGIINSGQTITVRVTSATSLEADTRAEINIGGITGVFTVTTRSDGVDGGGGDEDTSPNAFFFAEKTGVAPSATIESNATTIRGINTSAPISITGGQYSINGANFTGENGSINSGQSLVIQVVAPSTLATKARATILIGDVQANFDVTTRVADGGDEDGNGSDTQPNQFFFTTKTNAVPGTSVESNDIVIRGIDAPTPITITGGQYSIGSASYTDQAGTVSVGQVVAVRVNASDNFATTTSATLTIGDISNTFNVTTAQEDTTPAPFFFPTKKDAELNALVLSSTITISDINTPTPITIVGGEYSIDNADFIASAGIVAPGQTVRLRLAASAQPRTNTQTTVNIGGINAVFTVTTKADTTPDDFPFATKEDLPLNSEAISETITIGGFNVASPISIIGGEFSLNGDSFSDRPRFIVPGQTVTLRTIAAETELTSVEVTLIVGGVTSKFIATTGALPIIPDDFNINFSAAKTFLFTWTDSPSATVYRIAENPDGASGFSLVGDNIPPQTEQFLHLVPLYARTNAQYVLEICNLIACVVSDTVTVSESIIDSIGYIKASNTGPQDNFRTVSLSGDGRTLAVGAEGEDSNAKGVFSGDLSITENQIAQENNSAGNSGAVYVFTKDGNKWVQEAYLKASNAQASDRFGGSVNLDVDGNTLVIGASFERSNATGVDGDQENNSEIGAGAAYVFVRKEGIWQQQAYIKASDTDSNDFFGDAISLSHSGDTLAVGARQHGFSGAGAVDVYQRTGDTWEHQQQLKASNYGPGGLQDFFGVSVSLSADGNTLAVGANREDNTATGVDSDIRNTDARNSGAVYLFVRTEGVWIEQTYIKASNTGREDRFGSSVSISGDGQTLAVSAPNEDSNARGIDGLQDNDEAESSGAVYVFRQVAGIWAQQAYLKASNADTNDLFGHQLSLSNDGSSLAVSAINEQSFAQSLNGEQSQNSGTSTGAVYMFTREGETWQQQAYVKSSNTDDEDRFGIRLSLSDDGETLAVGASGESSNTTGTSGDQENNQAENAGAVYIY